MMGGMCCKRWGKQCQEMQGGRACRVADVTWRGTRTPWMMDKPQAVHAIFVQEVSSLDCERREPRDRKRHGTSSIVETGLGDAEREFACSLQVACVVCGGPRFIGLCVTRQVQVCFRSNLPSKSSNLTYYYLGSSARLAATRAVTGGTVTGHTVLHAPMLPCSTLHAPCMEARR